MDDKSLVRVFKLGMDLLPGAFERSESPQTDAYQTEMDRQLMEHMVEISHEILRRWPIARQAAGIDAKPNEGEIDINEYALVAALPLLRNCRESLISLQAGLNVHRLVRERASRTLFYPHPPFSCDWNPLFHLSHLCDTFIFADLENRHDIREQLENIQNNTPVGVGLSLVGEVRQFNLDLQPFEGGVPGLGLGNNPEPILIEEAARMGQLQRLPACRCWEADIERTVGTTRRLLKVIYIQAGGITAYLRLFHAQNCAPRIVCFRRNCPQWGPFYNLDGLFSRALHAQKDKIEYLLGWEADSGFHGWEWSLPMMKFRFWHAEQPTVYDCLGAWWPVVCLAKPQHLTVPDGAAFTLQNSVSNRSVILIKGLLSPADVTAGTDAVVISDQLLPQDWDDNLYKIVLVAGGIPHAHGRRSFLTNLRSPMGIVLNEITAVCQQQNLKSVACIGLGFEDEAPALQQWLTQEGAPLTLRIHCPDDGDFLSLSGFLR